MSEHLTRQHLLHLAGMQRELQELQGEAAEVKLALVPFLATENYLASRKINTKRCSLLNCFLLHLDFVWVELPLLFTVKGRHIHSSWNEAVATAQCNGLQWPLDAIKDCCQQAWSKLH